MAHPPQLQDIAVLVVEDDEDYRELTLATLRECCDPARILGVADGERALDWLLGRRAHAGRDTRRQPRLVVLDLTLERVHGIDVLEAMRDDPLTQGVPVVVLSGTSDKAELDRCYQAGANSVVRKTVDPAELRRKLHQMYEFWITVNEANRNSRV
ncbi:response regulator [Ramlibacter sp. PS4R-6]|uniref:response regulator n=1 Tax=Ramlibacter sp. PS4R-6 TaxID=3133438 RepID=UPI0030B61722